MTQGYSEYGYYVRKPSALNLLFANNAPASAGESRDTMNNLNHLADESGQVWACDGLVSGRYRDTDQAGSFTRPEHMARVVCHSIRTRPVGSTVGGSTADGGAYRLRVRIGGATSNGAVTFYIIAGVLDSPTGGIASSRAAALALGSASLQANETSATTASATEAWLTTGSTTLTVSAGLLASSRRTIPTYAYDASDTAIIASTDVYSIAVDIFGYTSAATTKPRLYGLYVAEFVGA